jgi:serine phosphatase RsbU (regulator of sigma subunit)
MKNILNKIINIGITNDLPNDRIRKIRILNGVGLIGGIVMLITTAIVVLILPRSFDLSYLGDLLFGSGETKIEARKQVYLIFPIIDFLIFLLCVSIILLNYFKKHSISILIICVSSQLLISIFYILSNVLVVIFFIIPAVLPLIFYNNKFPRYFLSFTNFFLFSIVTIISYRTGSLYNIDVNSPVIGIFINVAAVLVLLHFIISHFKNENLKNENKLSEKNEILQSQAAEISAQRDELQATNIKLEQQNEEITAQKDEIKAQHEIVLQQKYYIEKQNRKITDSINYARRIQHALLPDISQMSELQGKNVGVSDSFILFCPKEIVSGDFYWANYINNSLVVAVADCTGHGVPGAFMSMLGISFLNEIVNKQENLLANEILNKLSDYVKTSMKQVSLKGDFDTPVDGMNIVIAVIDMNNMNMQYSGSYRPLYMIRNNELNIFKTDHTTIDMLTKKRKTFTNNFVNLQKNDVLYLFSDGYIDQFDSEGKQKFNSARFKDLLLNINSKPLNEQKEILVSSFESWKGNHEQIDDVTVLGIRI